MDEVFVFNLNFIDTQIMATGFFVHILLIPESAHELHHPLSLRAVAVNRSTAEHLSTSHCSILVWRHGLFPFWILFIKWGPPVVRSERKITNSTLNETIWMFRCLSFCLLFRHLHFTFQFGSLVKA